MRDGEHDDIPVFEPVAVARVAEAVIEQIERLILQGVLRPGQKLPPERDLAERLGVSRPKLREAIHALEARGLIEIRRTEGAFVAPLTGEVLSPALLSLMGRHAEGALDVLEFRRAQESLAANLAARRATEPDRVSLADRLERMNDAAERDQPARAAELDLSFHIAVAEAAHNTMLLQVMRAIYALLGRAPVPSREALHAMPDSRRQLAEQHRALADAVIAGEPERAAEAAAAHVDYLIEAAEAERLHLRRTRIARKRGQVAGLPGAFFPPERR